MSRVAFSAWFSVDPITRAEKWYLAGDYSVWLWFTLIVLCQLSQYVRGSTYMHNDYRLLFLCVRVISSQFKHFSQVWVNEGDQTLCTLCNTSEILISEFWQQRCFLQVNPLSSINYLIETQLMCHRAKDHLTCWLVICQIDVMHVVDMNEWVDCRYRRDGQKCVLNMMSMRASIVWSLKVQS
jgi:hypothetical protein